jgi:ribulose-bisphosphate carboxylase large chain
MLGLIDSGRFSTKLLSGERFTVSYLLSGSETEARDMAADICFEQTVEFPQDLVPRELIEAGIVGRVEEFGPAGQGFFRADISFAIETADTDITQLLNVIYGNISIKPGIRVDGVDFPERLVAVFPGPRFGREGLRELIGVDFRPLTSTALKPMGLSPEALADQAYRFALGGIDIIKDDHGIANQAFCPFEERVARCAEAVNRANRETGLKSIYMANVTGPMDGIVEKARRAKELGAGALLICPSLTGFDALRVLAEREDLGLPLMAHPSFGGLLATSKNSGISHRVLYGTLTRLVGADAIVYPNFGGRFSFSKTECLDIAEASGGILGTLKAAFPAPGGGMLADRVEDMFETYGMDFILLIGAGLHRRSGDLTANAKYVIDMLEKN